MFPLNRPTGCKPAALRYLLPLLLTLAVALQAWSAPVTVRILHFNDFHGFANPSTQSRCTETLGGAARFAGAIRQNRDNATLLLAAGDIIQGDTWANLFQGSSSLELMNLLQIDAMVLGNHEFDFGQQQLLRLLAIARFPVLAANIEGVPATKARVSFVRNGIRITVVGLTTDDTPRTSHPRNTIGLTFRSPLAVARQQISEAAAESDLIVLLTHIGHDQDRALAQALCGAPAATTLPILIVGGHSHTKLDEPVRIGACTVVQAWEHGKVLGRVDYTFDSGTVQTVTGRLVEPAGEWGTGVAEVAALVDRYNRAVDAKLGADVGSTAVELSNQGARMQETALGNLVADLARETAGAQIAIINGGSLRTGLPAGRITARQVYAALPFDNYLVAVRMNGRQVLAALEHGVSAVEQGAGRFPQVSGVRFSFRRDRPPGSRIVAVTVAGSPLEPEREYTVATFDFLAAGGDGYVDFGQAIRSAGDFASTGGALQSSRLTYNDPGRYLRDIVLERLAGAAPLTARVEGRITEIR